MLNYQEKTKDEMGSLQSFFDDCDEPLALALTHATLYLQGSDPLEFSLLVPMAMAFEILNNVNATIALMRTQNLTCQKLLEPMEKPQGLAVYIDDTKKHRLTFIASEGDLLTGMRFYTVDWHDHVVCCEPIRKSLAEYGKRVLYVSANPCQLAGIRMDTLNIGHVPDIINIPLHAHTDFAWCVLSEGIIS